MKTFTVCDIETTGTNPLNVEIVEIYMGRYNLRGTLLGEIHLHIKPRYWNSAADASVEFHGITKEKAMEGIPWKEGMKQIWDFLPEEPEHFICHANRRMFGRQGCFDYQVLCSHFLDCGFPFYSHFMRVYPAQKIISTHSLAKELLGISKNDLKEVCLSLGVKLVNHHTAKNDAGATWKIFQKLKTKVNLDAFCEEDYYQLQKGIPQTDSSDKIKEKSMTDGFVIFNTHTTQGETYDEN